MICSSRFILGPVDAFLLDGEATASAKADASGSAAMRTLNIRGSVPWAHADQLLTVCANPERAITLGGGTGVVEPLWFDYEPWRVHNGLYLWSAEESGSDFNQDSATIRTINLEGAFLGRQPVLVHSGRALPNSLGIAGVPLMVSPFWDENGEFFSPLPSTYFVREYDETFPNPPGDVTEILG